MARDITVNGEEWTWKVGRSFVEFRCRVKKYKFILKKEEVSSPYWQCEFGCFPNSETREQACPHATRRFSIQPRDIVEKIQNFYTELYDNR